MERQSLLLALTILTATTFNASAQSQFLGLPGSAYIDNIADSQAVRLGSLANPFGEVEEDRLWTTLKVSGTYSFSRAESKPRRSLEQDIHAFVPELFLESATGWLLNVGGLFANSSEDGPFGDDLDSNIYGVSVQPAYDILSTAWAENRPKFMEHSRLVAGIGLGYTHAETDYDFSFGFDSFSLEMRTDTFLISPNLVFVQPLSENLVAFLIPAYTMAWSRTEVEESSRTFNNNAGVFTLTARGDYKVAERCFAAAFATWKRNTNSKPSIPSVDWAEFGAQLRFALSEKFAFRVGYSFEAFHRALRRTMHLRVLKRVSNRNLAALKFSIRCR